VIGLRREEIAELVGVSNDWYRWFESGRQIRVSVTFLAKLCQALQLTPIEQISLFYLALPEIYEAYVALRNFVISLITAQAS
jgi:transcriptional regulator with XRE-family HTH domain